MAQKILLLIEDDDFLRTLMTHKLERANYEVISSPNGEHGLKKISEHSPDLLILDLLLPNLSGFEVLKEIRKNEDTKNLEVIIFSNLGDEKDISKCKSLGVTEYLIKSNFTLDELVEKVNKFFEK